MDAQLFNRRLWITLCATGAGMWVLAALLLSRLIPGRREVDLFMVGTIATLTALLSVFAVFWVMSGRRTDLLFSSRRRVRQRIDDSSPLP